MSEPRWQNAAEEMYCASVIPRRSVRRIRNAIAGGVDPEPFLQDIEDGMEAILRIYREADNRPPACPTCHGTGRALPSSAAAGQTQGGSEG